MPPALERMADGLVRIAETVRSMKDFANADQSAMVSVDLNRKIASTLVVARSEYSARRRRPHGVRAAAADQLQQRPDQSGDPQPRRELGARDLGCGREERHARQDHGAHGVDGDDVVISVWPTPGAAFPRTSVRASSTRSSRPRRSGAARARGCRSLTTWWSRVTAARFSSRPKWAAARPSTYACRSAATDDPVIESSGRHEPPGIADSARFRVADRGRIDPGFRGTLGYGFRSGRRAVASNSRGR